MGQAAVRVRAATTLPFTEFPGLAAASTAGHPGAVTLGDWAGVRVLVFHGRLHFYEGHSWDVVTAPVRAAAALGARVLVLTNAAGGIADELDPGSLMAVRDHLDWTQAAPRRTLGPGGLAGSPPSPYSSRVLGLMISASEAEGLRLSRGVYAAVTGPCYETPAEIRALRNCGADAVGMSTAREAQAAADAGMEVAAVSLIANRAAGLAPSPLAHADVLAAAAAAAGRLADLLGTVLPLVVRTTSPHSPATATESANPGKTT
jgi:purine-nucleoside phosphorylase